MSDTDKYVRVISIVERESFDVLNRNNYRQVSADDIEIDFTAIGYEDTFVPSRSGNGQ